MYESNNKIETRIFVKISFNEKGISALRKTVYFRNEMGVDFFQRWRWYFEYRAALLLVKHPKAFIELTHGPYEYVLPEDEYREKVKNRYFSDKRQLTRFDNKLKQLCKNWDQLFPIEEYPDWIKITKKKEWYDAQLTKSKAEYDAVFSQQ